ncbi:MAG: tetratricopeptide repeat protein [Pseudomonadota bacterium]
MKRNLGLTTLAIPLVLAGCASSESELQSFGDQPSLEVPGSTSYATAKTHFSSGRYGLAIKSFHAAVKSDSSSIESLNGLAASYDQVGRFDLAERYYRQALSLDPESSQSLNNLGYSYMLQGKYDLAAVYLREAKLLGEGSEIIEANQQTAEAALQASGRKPAETLASEPVIPVETTQVASQPRARIERTSKNVQSLRIADSMDQFASRGEVGTVSAAARFIAAGDVESQRPRSPGPEPRPAVIAIMTTRSSEEVVANESAAGSLEPLVFLLNSPQDPIIEISNGTGRERMAARMRAYLTSGGLEINWLSNADHYNHTTSTIYFKEAWRSHAEALAALVPAQVELVKNDLQRSHLRLELGGDLLDFDAQLYIAETEVANETS